MKKILCLLGFHKFGAWKPDLFVNVGKHKEERLYKILTKVVVNFIALKEGLKEK